MKALSLISVLFTTLTAHAAIDLSGHYHGNGVWKMENGVNGTHSSIVEISKSDRGYTVKEKLTINSQEGSYSEEMTWNADITKNGFFDVVIDGAKVGSGFCFNQACTLTGVKGEKKEAFGESFLVNKNGKHLDRMGYADTAEGRVAWTGHLQMH